MFGDADGKSGKVKQVLNSLRHRQSKLLVGYIEEFVMCPAATQAIN